MNTKQGNFIEGSLPVASSKRLKGKKINEFINEVYGKEGTPGREELERYFVMEDIGEMLKEIRSVLDISQTELGKRIGVKRAQISRLEKNESNLTMATLLKFLKGLHVNANLVIQVPGKKIKDSNVLNEADVIYKVKISASECGH